MILFNLIPLSIVFKCRFEKGVKQTLLRCTAAHQPDFFLEVWWFKQQIVIILSVTLETLSDKYPGESALLNQHLIGFSTEVRDEWMIG